MSNSWIFVLVFIITCYMRSCHAADQADDDDAVGSPPSAEKTNNTNVTGIINSWILNRYLYI